MLSVILSEDAPMMDVDVEFLKLSVADTPLVRTLLKEIERAEYCSPTSFIDRYGFKLPIDHLSTGCKTALLVALKPDLLVDLSECGDNARDAILMKCRDGHIKMHFPLSMIAGGRDLYKEERDIDVAINGFRITNVYRLNDYFFMDMLKDPAHPDLSSPGIEKLDAEE